MTQLTITDVQGNVFTIEVDLQETVETLKALIEVQVRLVVVHEHWATHFTFECSLIS